MQVKFKLNIKRDRKENNFICFSFIKRCIPRRPAQCRQVKLFAKGYTFQGCQAFLVLETQRSQSSQREKRDGVEALIKNMVDKYTRQEKNHDGIILCGKILFFV